jgi:Na+-transporting NADH:ubiquinone oxidoreductase subunit E
MEHYLNLAAKSIFVENMVLAYFLGMCSFLAVSKKIETAMGLGAAVVFVLTITTPLNWVIHEYLLKKGGLGWAGMPHVDLSFLNFILFIAVIAAVVQLVEMFLDRYSQRLYTALGIFLPLIAVNCSILGSSLFIVERKYDFWETTVFGASAGIGFALAITALAAIRTKIRYSNVPKGLRGLGMAMLLTGLMALAFQCFAGIQL